MANKTAMLNYNEAISAAIAEEMRRDERVVIWGEDVGRNRANLVQEFGEKRVRNTPIVEVAFVEMAVGAALTGLRPIVVTSSGFVPIFFDGVFLKVGNYWQLHNYKGPVPIVIYASVTSEHGQSADHSLSPESLLMHSPGLMTVMPSTPYDAKGLLKAAIRSDRPVVYMPHGNLGHGEKQAIPTEDYIVPLGKADVKREGKDVTICSYSYMMSKVLKAAEDLSKEGISVEVVDLRSLVPLDIQTVIKSVKKTRRLLIAHEAMERGGAAGEILFRFSDAAPDLVMNLKSPVRRVAAKNIALPHGARLEKMVVAQVPDIIKVVKEMV